MANKKKNFWYVLVISNHGPAFVTKVNRSNKYAEWNTLEKPLELGEYWAKDLAFGLNLNFNLAYPVCYPVEIENQPYMYDKYNIQFVEKEEQDNAED